MNWRIPLADIDYGPEESKAVEEVLLGRWLTMGPKTCELEETFASYLRVKHAIAVTNGTAALHIACQAIGLKSGDEAVVPSLTFVATANAVRYTGADPVFADIVGTDDFDISPESIKNLISDRTRALLVVHYGGYACDMHQIVGLAERNGLFIIEDAAHAVGSELDGRKLGTWGDIGCFSFFSNKNLAAGEGGMVVTNNDQLAEKLRLLRSHGMTTLTWDRHKGHAWSYDVVELGYNYRIDEMRAALALVQLSKLDMNNARRKELTELYQELLHQYAPMITTPFRFHPGDSACHIMPILLSGEINRRQFMEFMKSNGIQTSIHYPPIHLFTAYEHYSEPTAISLPLTNDIAFREVTLPLYPTLDDSDVKTVVRFVGLALQKAMLDSSNK